MDNPFGTSFSNFDDEQNENSKQPSKFILFAKIILPYVYICLQNWVPTILGSENNQEIKVNMHKYHL